MAIIFSQRAPVETCVERDTFCPLIKVVRLSQKPCVRACSLVPLSNKLGLQNCDVITQQLLNLAHCFVLDRRTPKIKCDYVNYFTQIDRDGLGPTDAILRTYHVTMALR